MKKSINSLKARIALLESRASRENKNIINKIKRQIRRLEKDA